MNNHSRKSKNVRLNRLEKRIIAVSLAIVVLIAVILLIVPSKPKKKQMVMLVPEETALPAEESGTESAETAPSDTAAAEPKVTAEAEPVPESIPSVDASRTRYLPQPQEGDSFLPVLKKAVKCNEKIIAITVDDCNQPGNLQKIIDRALQYDAKITIFPIGQNTVKPAIGSVLKAAWEAGMEIENHTYTHNGLYNASDARLAKEIYMANLAISYTLGVNYTCHFMRPRGGDASEDQRIHAYCTQNGYYGVAKWSVVGSDSTIYRLQDSLAPGQIYLFHTKDSDWQLLKEFIVYASQQGYKMVTLNEMFGLPDNETTPLTEPINPHNVTIPPLQPYEEKYVTLKKGTYLYAVTKLQERLRELGYTNAKGDGCYGAGTERAVKAFQSRAGLKADGIAGPETQAALFAENAPRA